MLTQFQRNQWNFFITCERYIFIIMHCQSSKTIYSLTPSEWYHIFKFGLAECMALYSRTLNVYWVPQWDPCVWKWIFLHNVTSSAHNLSTLTWKGNSVCKPFWLILKTCFTSVPDFQACFLPLCGCCQDRQQVCYLLSQLLGDSL